MALISPEEMSNILELSKSDLPSKPICVVCKDPISPEWARDNSVMVCPKKDCWREIIPKIFSDKKQAEKFLYSLDMKSRYQMIEPETKKDLKKEEEWGSLPRGLLDKWNREKVERKKKGRYRIMRESCDTD